MGSNPSQPASRVERKKEETKQKIVTVAVKLFMEQGLDATTMEQIADEVDIAKGTLYKYFPAKEAILSAYVQRAFRERNAERLERLKKLPDTRARLVQVLSELMQGVQAYPEIFERFHTYQVQKMISLRQDESMATGIGLLSSAIIELGQESGEVRTDLPLDLLIDLFEFVFIEVAVQFYQQPEAFDAQASIERGVDLFLNGAKPPNLS